MQSLTLSFYALALVGPRQRRVPKQSVGTSVARAEHSAPSASEGNALKKLGHILIYNAFYGSKVTFAEHVQMIQ